MASTLVAGPSEYAVQCISERCGEVYCSQNRDKFLINCVKCLKEFDMLDNILFIQHIKDCLVPVYDPNSINVEFKLSECSNSLLDVKQEDLLELDSYCDYMSAVEEESDADFKKTIVEEPIGTMSTNLDHTDPLIIGSKNSVIPNEAMTKKQQITELIIEEYKKRPILWDPNLRSGAEKGMISRAYIQITKIINSEFDVDYSNMQVREKIVRLRTRYRDACKKIKEHEEFYGDTIDPSSSIMWAYNKMAFIDCPPVTPKNEESEKDKGSQDDDLLLNEGDSTSFHATVTPKDEESSAGEEMPNESEDSEDNLRKRSRKKKHFPEDSYIPMIELFKASPVLWNTSHPLYNNATKRKNTYKEIVARLKEDYNISLTSTEYSVHMRHLRFLHARYLGRSTTGNNTLKKPWYYEHLSFLEPVSETVVHASEPKIREDMQFLTEDLPLMTDFISRFKANPCLWDANDKNRDSLAAEEKAFENLKELFSIRNIEITKVQIRSAIEFLRSVISYARKQKNIKGEHEPPKYWFFHQLGFLETKIRVKQTFCYHCNKRFPSINEWERHILDIGDFPYKCDICNKGFPSRKQFRPHQLTHQEPHECEICGFKSHDKGNYVVHMRRHNEIKAFACQLCDKAFVSSSELRQHMRMHRGEKRWVCEICGKATTTSSHLTQHVKRHLNQRDHKCQVCGKGFITKSSLKDHAAKHSDARPHPCTVCGAAFKTKKDLGQHSALHLPEKKYACKICKKQFAQYAGVVSHMKSHDIAKDEK